MKNLITQDFYLIVSVKFDSYAKHKKYSKIKQLVDQTAFLVDRNAVSPTATRWRKCAGRRARVITTTSKHGGARGIEAFTSTL